MSTVKSRIRALDGMRGIGVVCVMLIHIYPRQLFWFWCFVDMFFVLSGYLITAIALRNIHHGTFKLSSYFARRALRIWPVYYATLLAAFILGVLQSNIGNTPANYEWWSSLIFIQNYQGYFGPWDSPSTLAPWFRSSWSIAAEEQFYLLWPLALLLIRANFHTIVVAISALLVCGIVLRSEGYLLILLLTRIDGIAMGILLAVATAEQKTLYSTLNRSPLYFTALLTGGAIALAYLYDGYHSGTIQNYGDIARHGNWTLNVTGFSLFFFGLIGLILKGELPRTSNILGNGVLVYLGTISYAIYMTQGVVRTVSHEIFERLPFGSHLMAELATIPLTILLAAASWKYMEEPINSLKSRFPMKGVVSSGGN